MHFGFATFGTFGDIAPFLPLVKQCLEQGHHISLVVNPHFKGKVEAALCDLSSPRLSIVVAGHPWDPELVLQDERNMDPRHVWKHIYMPQVRPFFHELEAIHAHHALDLVLTHAWTIGAIFAALKFELPFVCVALQPMLWMSLDLPPRMDARHVPPWLRRPILKQLMPWIYKQHFIPPLLDLASELGLDLGDPRALPFDGLHQRAACSLGFWDPLFRPAQGDDHANRLICGFPGALPSMEELDEELEAFCLAHKPWVMGLGSALPKYHQRPYQLLCKATNDPLVLVGADPKHLPSPLPRQVKVIPYAPYDLLFPLARGVLHHGGIGTTSQALHAGVPQGVLAMGNDMFDNGERVEALGVGKILDGKRLTTSKLKRLLQTLDGEPYRERAAHLSPRLMRRGTQAERVCDTLEKLVITTG